MSEAAFKLAGPGFELRTREARSGFALLEVMIAILIMGLALLFLLQVRNQTITAFTDSGDQHTAAWLAEMKMNELLCQRLPDPEDPDTFFDEDSGDFRELDGRLHDFNRRVNPKWVERDYLGKFTYHWTKELIFIGSEFTGNKEDLDNWEQPVDANGEPTDEKDPRTQPAARVVRVTLEVMLPLARGNDSEGSAESDTQFEKRKTIKLVTYIDPATLRKVEEEPAAETTTPATTPK